MRNPQLDARLRMVLTPGLGPILSARLEEVFESPQAVVNASVSQLQQIEGIGNKNAQHIKQGFDDADLEKQYQLIDQHNVKLIPIDDPEYPLLLKHIHDPPPLLFVRGRLDHKDTLAISIVGSRRCTLYGREQTDRLAAAASQSGLTIISGGARGIDSIAHNAVLRVDGRTIAVMGCGLDVCYPPENQQLFDKIVDNHGALISELPMTTPPIAQNFPSRNRIISGMALGVLVVEAANRSGALITARLAAEEHHREVMALPGRIDSTASAGCHRIIREGWAALVTSIADILDQLGEAGHMLSLANETQTTHNDDNNNDNDEPNSNSSFTSSSNSSSNSNPITYAALSDEQKKLFDAITIDPIDVDLLIRQTSLPVATVQSHLMRFQLQGLIEKIGGNRVKRR